MQSSLPETNTQKKTIWEGEIQLQYDCKGEVNVSYSCFHFICKKENGL